jgi:hypothetical protein
MEMKINLKEATYYVNEKLSATCVFTPGDCPEEGYVGFLKYTPNWEVRGLTIE